MANMPIAVLLVGLFAAQSNLVEINGAKTPDQIPQYALWTSAFHFLQKSGDDPGVRDSLKTKYLPLSAKDDELVWRTVKQAQGKEADNHKIMKEKFDLAMNATQGEKARRRDEYREQIVQMRQDMLDLADDLMQHLSPDGQVAMEAWKESFRESISFTVTKDDLAFFKRPR